jgi:hypothetical protein
MADAGFTIFRGAATTSSVRLYTAPTSTATLVTNIGITNTAATASTATINLATVALLSGVTIPANSTQFIDLQQIVFDGETITATASTSAVNFHIAGTEVY